MNQVIKYYFQLLFGCLQMEIVMKLFSKKCVAAAVLLAGVWIGDVQGQSVVVNEFSQGSGGNREWLELLVVDDNVDMRGWEVGDNDDGVWATLVEFTTDANWSSVNAGTLIVIYNGGDVDGTIAGADTDFSDNVVLIPHDNATYFTDTGAWPGGAFGNTDPDDAPAIRDAADTMVHDMVVTHPTATVTAPGSTQVKYFIEDSVAEITANANWTVAGSTNGTPGVGNGGNNTTWVTTLNGGSGGPTTNVRFSVSVDSTSEAAGTYNVTVIKTLPEGNVSGQIQLGGTATEGGLNDYTVSDTNFTLNGATTSATVTVTINEDATIEPPETIVFTLVNIAGGTLSAPSVLTLTISDNDTPPSTLFISEVADPSDNFDARFVEFYNAGESDVDLAAGSWFLSKQVNGASWADISLTGTVTAGSTYVIAFSSAAFLAAYPSANTPNQFSGDINGNGDDGYFLYSGGSHITGTLADAYGVIGQDGTGNPWEYLDTRAVRTSSVVQGSTTWTASEWFIPETAATTDMTPGVHPDGEVVISTNIRFSVSAATTNESAGTYVVSIIKTTPDGDVSGEITLAGTATEGALNDYTIDTTNFTLNGAVDTTNITITINNDTDQEASETIVLGFANVVGAGIVAPTSFTLTIQANDAPPLPGGVVWINEINYNPAGADSNEFVEIAGPAGADLSPYQLIWYNGANGEVYGSNVLTGVIDDEGCEFGAVSFDTPSNQNGPDGFALVSNGTVVLEFISYGGSFLATTGPAAGLDSTDIGVVQTGSDQNTVQLGGAGDTASEFTWEVAELSKGSLNTNQTITPCIGVESPPILSAIGNKVTLTNALVSFTISAAPTDGDVVTLSVSNAPVGSAFGSTNENGQFTWTSPGPAGVYTISFYAADNDGADFETITITVTNSPPPPPAVSRNVWFNEIHYDNLGGDTNEGFEVAGDAGIDLSAYTIVLYDGTSGFAYSNNVLSGVIPDQSNGLGAVWVDFGYDPAGHIQNGAPDGMALVYNSTGVIQFLSYEGVFIAGDGPAIGLQSTDILVRQNSSTSGTNISYTSDFTLQLCGTGTNYAEMLSTGSWQYPQLHTKNAFSSCQVIPGGSLPPASEYEIGGFSFSGGLPTAAVTTEVGYIYSLQYITNLLSTNVSWLTIDSEAGTGGAVFLNDGSPTNSSRFYRISAE